MYVYACLSACRYLKSGRISGPGCEGGVSRASSTIIFAIFTHTVNAGTNQADYAQLGHQTQAWSREEGQRLAVTPYLEQVHPATTTLLSTSTTTTTPSPFLPHHSFKTHIVSIHLQVIPSEVPTSKLCHPLLFTDHFRTSTPYVTNRQLWEQALKNLNERPFNSIMEQQPQQPAGGVLGPTGRRLHIAHRRSPSELTPLMSMFSSPGSKSNHP